MEKNKNLTELICLNVFSYMQRTEYEAYDQSAEGMTELQKT